jgi:glycine cleavage system H protein
MRYAETHEWIEVDGEIGTVGISAFARNELGEIVYVELPKIGKQVKKGEEAAVLESTKAAADVYSPVSGTIVEVNSGLVEHPEWILHFPEGQAEEQGWLFKLRLSAPNELDALMNQEDYKNAF